MTKLISKTDLEKQIPVNKTTRNVGEIYPQIFEHDKNITFGENMSLEIAVIWLGTFSVEGSIFPKKKCPVCGREEVLIPYLCGGSALSGCHTIQFYCTHCAERFVTNDNIDYFRLIKDYIIKNKDTLKPSKHFINCSTN